MTEWTADRLDALPTFTALAYALRCRPNGHVWAFMEEAGLSQPWATLDGSLSSLSLLEEAHPGSIRVVSVPIDALLSEGTARAIDPLGIWSSVKPMLRAAIAHVTGGSL